MTKHIIRFLLVFFHLTYSYAGVKILDIEIGKTKVIELWKKGYELILIENDRILENYSNYFLKVSQKIYGCDKIIVTSEKSGKIRRITIEPNREYIKEVHGDLLKLCGTPKEHFIKEPIVLLLFQKGETTIVFNYTSPGPLFNINYMDTEFFELQRSKKNVLLKSG